MSRNLVSIPKALANELDTYFQTSRFAQKEFTKFNKGTLLARIVKVAARFRYTVDQSAFGPNFKGVFKLSCKSKALRVSAATLPLAEDWTD